MKKEIKSYEELAKCDGMKFEAEYDGKKLSGIVCCRSNYIKLRYDLDNDWESYVLMGKDYCEVYFPVFNIIVEDTEEWIPKFGEVVEVSNGKEKWFKRIFIGEYDGVVHCVKEGDESYFKKYTLNGYNVLQWGNIRRYEEPKIEINIEEAKRIIAGNKGVNPENLTIKGL